jgi:hypothetical protein
MIPFANWQHRHARDRQPPSYPKMPNVNCPPEAAAPDKADLHGLAPTCWPLTHYIPASTAYVPGARSSGIRSKTWSRSSPTGHGWCVPYSSRETIPLGHRAAVFPVREEHLVIRRQRCSAPPERMQLSPAQPVRSRLRFQHQPIAQARGTHLRWRIGPRSEGTARLLAHNPRYGWAWVGTGCRPPPHLDARLPAPAPRPHAGTSRSCC